MGKLFDLGYRMGKAGYPWEKKPPARILHGISWHEAIRGKGSETLRE
jgi:hypothetical protein